MNQPEVDSAVGRRTLMGMGLAAAGVAAFGKSVVAADVPMPLPASDRNILLSCKLGMIARNRGDATLSLVERLTMAQEAGFDGVDFDEAGKFTEQEARDAVQQSGVFVHNAINHQHWQIRLTSADAETRAKSRANVEHCIRLSHAAGGNGVLIVVGRADDGTEEELLERCNTEIRKMIPLAASLGQPILIENVWNRMMYDHDGSPDQSAKRFVDFVDGFNSRWVGMYYDIGNHWKYGSPGQWIREFGHRCVKLDVKGFSRKENKFTDIGEGDLPWNEVREALADIHFTGWATAEVGGGDVERLTVVRKQMEKVFGLV